MRVYTKYLGLRDVDEKRKSDKKRERERQRGRDRDEREKIRGPMHKNVVKMASDFLKITLLLVYCKETPYFVKNILTQNFIYS